MNRLPSIIQVTILFFVLSPLLLAGEKTPDDAGIKTILRERIERDKKGVGIVAGVIDSQGTRIITYGTAGYYDGRKLNGDSVFEIGSITKVFTSLILADMVKHGEVKLDDPISKYLPVSVKAPSRNGRQITLVDLATHTSGLPRLPDNFAPRDNRNPYADYTVQQLYEFLGNYTLPRDIGAEYEYSNLGGGLLGHLLGLKAGTNYEALVWQRVCQPLGLTNTRITLSPELQARFAQGHDEKLRVVPNWDFPTLAGCGGLRSTANDLLKFATAAMGRTRSDLQPALELSETPRNQAFSTNMQIGLGWHIATEFGVVVWHNGGTGGFRSFIGFDKKKQLGVVVLGNSANDVGDIGFHLLNSQYKLKESKPAANRVAIKLPAKILDDYAGHYQLNSRLFFNVRRAGDHLEAMLAGQSYADIFAEDETNFFYEVVDAQMTFERDANGRATALVLHQNGIDQTAKKISNEIPKEKERVAIRLIAEKLDAYAGIYQLTPEAIFTIRRDGDHLMAQLSGQAFYEIFPESETEFFYKIVDAQLSFVKTSKGEVTQLVLHQSGLNQPAKKIK